MTDSSHLVKLLQRYYQLGSQKVYYEKSGKVTIDQLAIMIKQGFDHVDGRFEQLDRQLASINARLNNAVYQFEFISLSKRVGRLEEKVGISPE